MGYKDETGHLLALLRANDEPWHHIATLVANAGTAEGLVTGQITPPNGMAERLVAHVRPSHVEEAQAEVADWATRTDIAVWTVLDDAYPTSLRTIFNHPPFIFCRGEWKDDLDGLGLAIVGTRTATEEGLKRSGRMAKELAERDITVISGLALGIDSAAHRSALDHDGRTVAVVGSGLDHMYPPSNRALADEIVSSGGALVSQFVPTQRPSKASFPMRNAVMSGLARGTIVIEAGPTSGAKMQARLALEHGRPVFLLRSLVEKYEWAQKYVDKGRYGTRPVVVSKIEDILAVVDAADFETLALDLTWPHGE